MDSRRWHDWCTDRRPAEPAALSVKQWEEMDCQQRTAHTSELEQWLHQCYMATAQFDRVADGLSTIVDRNARTLPGAKEIPVLTGPNTIGKSVFARNWARERYLGWTAHADAGAAGYPVWYPTPDVESDLCPVVFINLQDDARKKALDSQILGFFNLPSGVTAEETTRSAMRAVLRHRVRMVVIDDVNLLKTEWRGARQVLDHIKHINTELGENNASLVLVGANLIGGGLLADPQINGRSKTFAIAQYEIDSLEEKRAWQRMIRDIESRLLPHLPAGKPGMLCENLAGEIWFRTQGYFQDIMQLIRDATIAATRDGTHEIRRDHLDAVTLSDRASAQSRAMEDRTGGVDRVKVPTASAGNGTPRNRKTKAVMDTRPQRRARRSCSPQPAAEDQ